ncbi:MAG: TetR/AcrR family transcriptional regulator [Alphaproteobacteria bacterium]
MSIEQYRQNLSQSKRNAIIQAAIETFLDKGFESAGMAKIAKVAEVSTATLYKHFSSKEELFYAITDRLITEQKLVEPSDGLENLSFEEGLLKIGNLIAALMNIERIVPLFRLVIAEAYQYPELRDRVYEVGHGPYKEALSIFLVDQQQSGKIDLRGVSPRFVAEQYIGMLYSFLLYARVMDKSVEISLEQAQQVVKECSALLVSRFNN